MVDELVKECMDIIECDTARISKSSWGMMYLIIGFNRNTKDDNGQWYNEKNEVVDWNYIHETVVASGTSEQELLESVREYKRLCDITMEEYLQEFLQELSGVVNG